MDDTCCIQPEFVHQRHCLSRLSETVVHADAAHTNGMVFGKELRYRSPQTAGNLVFFDGKYQTRFLCGLDEDFAIQRLDGVHVDDTS